MEDNNDRYKYLGVLEADDVKQESLKERLSKEYVRRVKKVIRSNFKGGNMVNAVNSLAVSLLCYSGGVV